MTIANRRLHHLVALLVVTPAGCGGAVERIDPLHEPSVANAAEALAGFDLSCEPEELSMRAFHVRMEFDQRVILVGAAGCGRRSYYEVRCAGPACRAVPITQVRQVVPTPAR